MSAPTVSVMMPVYNTKRYVAEAVESILAQTFTDFEFLIVDDGSSDGSLGILERYAARDSRIRLACLPHRGIVAARNHALGLATGEFCAVMDSDDVALPERFSRQVEYLRDHPDVICLGTGYISIDEKGRPISNLRVVTDETEIQEHLLSGVCPIRQPSVMMRRAAVESVRGYREEFSTAEDPDLWLRLGEIGLVVNLPDVLIKYRVHFQSVSSLHQQLQLERARNATRQAWVRRGLPERPLKTQEYRPREDRSSKHSFYLKYGWQAFSSGFRQSALRFGLKAMLSIPWRSEGWRLAACAILKKPVRRFQQCRWSRS
jgi:glycosyltransferase involved in cell wall biosynthesis